LFVANLILSIAKGAKEWRLKAKVRKLEEKGDLDA
jgi:hypothetical protein